MDANPHRSAEVSRRAGRLLVATVLLTVLCFVASTVISEWSEVGVARAADSIATNSAPSVSQLSGMRSDLRRLEVMMDDYTDRAVAGLPESGPGDALLARDAVRATW